MGVGSIIMIKVSFVKGNRAWQEMPRESPAGKNAAMLSAIELVSLRRLILSIPTFHEPCNLDIIKCPIMFRNIGNLIRV